MSRYKIIPTRERTLQFHAYTIGFNASKDIQEWMATVNLNLLT